MPTTTDQWPGLHNSIIKTERILLRPLGFDYMTGIFAHKSNPDIVLWKQPDTELWQSCEWVEKRLVSPKSWNFVVHYLPAEWRDKEPDACWLKPSHYDQDHILGICGVFDAAELGYAFHPKVWGKGIATEVVRGLIKAYWKTFPDGHPGVGDDEKNFLRACTEKSNLASAKVLQKCGFEFWEEVPDPIEVDATGRKKSEMLNMWRLWKPGCNGEKATLEQGAG